MSKLAGLQARAKESRGKNPQSRVVLSRPEAVEAEDGAQGPATAELWLYGVVGGYWWGFNSDEVADALRALGDVDEITVRLHSYGGSAVDGIAIANLLANHPARVRVVIDGIAASAATQVALAGDELIMSPGSQFMIHDAWMYVAGNAAELRIEADFLDKQSKNYAELYAHRAGGTAEEWRTRMTADGDGTWYTAAEAVEAGIADRVENIASTTPPPPVPDAPDDDLEDDDLAAALADVELLHPAARAAWSNWRGTRAPKPPAASADGSTTNRTKETAMAFTPEQLTQMRQDLGLPETADEATIAAALTEALAEQATETPAAPTTPAIPEGMTLVDQTTLASLQAAANMGREARTQQLTAHRDGVIAAAIADGKFAPARREHYLKAWESDPTGTEELINSLAKDLVPLSERGHAQPPAEDTTAAVDAPALSAFAGSLGLSEEDLRA